MSQTAIINKENHKTKLKSNERIKEEIKMSIVNMAMNIGVFKIDFSIEKDIERKTKMSRLKSEHNNRIKEAVENKNNTLLIYEMYNFLA